MCKWELRPQLQISVVQEVRPRHPLKLRQERFSQEVCNPEQRPRLQAIRAKRIRIISSLRSVMERFNQERLERKMSHQKSSRDQLRRNRLTPVRNPEWLRLRARNSRLVMKRHQSRLHLLSRTLQIHNRRMQQACRQAILLNITRNQR